MVSRLSALLLASCIALPAATSQAIAEQRERKTNFTSRSFDDDNGFWSQRQQRQLRQQRRDETTRTRSFDFLNNNRGFFSSFGSARDFDEELNRRERVRVTFDDDDGPDVASTGEQYYTYTADPLVSLVKADLKQPRPQGRLQGRSPPSILKEIAGSIGGGKLPLPFLRLLPGHAGWPEP